MLTNGQVQGHVLHAQQDSHVGGVSSGSAYIHEQHIFKYFSPQFLLLSIQQDCSSHCREGCTQQQFIAQRVYSLWLAMSGW